MIAHALVLLLIAIISLATKLIHAYTISPKANSPTQKDPEAPPPQNKNLELSQHQVQYHAPTDNINLYARHSRLLSPIDTDPRWDSHA